MSPNSLEVLTNGTIVQYIREHKETQVEAGVATCYMFRLPRHEHTKGN